MIKKLTCLLLLSFALAGCTSKTIGPVETIKYSDEEIHFKYPSNMEITYMEKKAEVIPPSDWIYIKQIDGLIVTFYANQMNDLTPVEGIVPPQYASYIFVEGNENKNWEIHFQHNEIVTHFIMDAIAESIGFPSELEPGFSEITHLVQDGLPCDPSSGESLEDLEELGHHYVKGKNGVYLRNVYDVCLGTVKDADPESFEALGYFGKDKAHIFHGIDILEGADWASFEILEEPNLNWGDCAQDKNRRYLGSVLLENKNGQNFDEFCHAISYE